jgi:LPS-assembly protein
LGKNFRAKKSCPQLALAFALLLCLAASAWAQQTNPVDRQVANPLTDTPNVNPLTQDQPIVPRKPVDKTAPQSTDEFTVTASKETVSGPKEARVFVDEGNVDARIGTYRLQADKVTVYEASGRVIAEGNVVFDQGELQRITGSRAEWNYRTKTGFFIHSTGYTNQTADGTTIYFTADSVEKVGYNTVVVVNAEITACEEDVPKWSFRTRRAEIKSGDRVRIKSPTFRIKGVPVLFLPYASVSIKKQDRASGFLTPTFGGSGNKGFRLSTAYYQTLGRSADATLRGELYAKRGLGFGIDVRTRANSRSFLNFGFYVVKDRIFGPKESADNPNQGGSSLYVHGVHYFPNGFLAAADVNITSNLTFRQVFSDNIQQAISPEERSQVFINKNFDDYSFNFLARSQDITLPNVHIRTRQIPSITLDKRPSALHYFKNLPVYFSFEGGLEGVSRKEIASDLALFRNQVQGEPILTPSLVQRLDLHPQFSVPVSFAGWSVTAMAGLRGTFYSNSIDPATRLILSHDLVRGYSEFELDVRPPALARNFSHRDGSFFFRHVIEPYIIYRRIDGISNFERIIRFDYTDTIANTNEIEFGVTNRFFTRRSTENVNKPAKPANKRRRGAPTRETAESNNETTASAGGTAQSTTSPHLPLSNQPYEALSITVRGKYFFDPYFGGALIPGQRNQFYPIDTFSGFTYGGVPRRFSPLNIEARYRPSRFLFADVRSDLDMQSKALRNLVVSFGLHRPFVQVFQTLYYTRAITLVPSLARFADASGKEPGTVRGSQWSPSVFVGNRQRGLFGGVSFFFDFQHQLGQQKSSLVNSVVTLGYSYDCCAVVIQNRTYNFGLRKENHLVFSFRLNGIGTFGTEQPGQAF